MKEFKADEMTKVVVYTYVFIYTTLWREFESLQTATLVGIPVFLSKFVLISFWRQYSWETLLSYWRG